VNGDGKEESADRSEREFRLSLKREKKEIDRVIKKFTVITADQFDAIEKGGSLRNE